MSEGNQVVQVNQQVTQIVAAPTPSRRGRGGARSQPYNIDQSDVRKTISVREEINKRKSQAAFPCEECGEIFIMLKDWKKHHSDVHGISQPFRCFRCPYTTNESRHLIRHIKCHQPIKFDKATNFPDIHEDMNVVVQESWQPCTSGITENTVVVQY